MATTKTSLEIVFSPSNRKVLSELHEFLCAQDCRAGGQASRFFIWQPRYRYVPYQRKIGAIIRIPQKLPRLSAMSIFEILIFEIFTPGSGNDLIKCHGRPNGSLDFTEIPIWRLQVPSEPSLFLLSSIPVGWPLTFWTSYSFKEV